MSRLGKLLLSAGQIYIPKVIGEEYGGGYFAGRLRANGIGYAIVVGGIAVENSGIAFSTTTGGNANSSDWDGNLNMQQLRAEGLDKYPAAQWCAGLSEGGYTDWIVPSKAMIEVIYRNLKTFNTSNVTNNGENAYADPATGNYTASDPAQTSVASFRQGGSNQFQGNFYWASTSSGDPVYVHNMLQGASGNSASTSTRLLRATRLVRMPD